MFTNILIAFALGVLPPLVWLLFWLQEDRLHPEPKKIIFLCFLGGMLTVPLVIPFEWAVSKFFVNNTVMLILWAAIEEIFKFGAAYVFGIRTKNDDEPIDAVIYLISVALGFAALENALYAFGPLNSNDFFSAFTTSNFRFIGSTILHTVASATVGIFIAFAFYKGKKYKITHIPIGLFFAIVLHSLFNMIIVQGDGAYSMIAFYTVWVGVVVLLVLLEKVKKLR